MLWPPSSHERASRSAGSGSASIIRRPALSGLRRPHVVSLRRCRWNRPTTSAPALERRRQVDLVDDLAAGGPRGPRLRVGGRGPRGEMVEPGLPGRHGPGLWRERRDRAVRARHPSPATAVQGEKSRPDVLAGGRLEPRAGAGQAHAAAPARDVDPIEPRAPDGRLGAVIAGPDEAHAAQGFVVLPTLPCVAVEPGFEGLGPEHGTSDVTAARLRREGPSASLHRRHLPAMHTLWRHGRP